jgi:hypothetical protein
MMPFQVFLPLLFDHCILNGHVDHSADMENEGRYFLVMQVIASEIYCNVNICGFCSILCIICMIYMIYMWMASSSILIKQKQTVIRSLISSTQ